MATRKNPTEHAIDETELSRFVGQVSHVLDHYSLHEIPMWCAVTPLYQTGDVSHALPVDPTRLLEIERAMVRWRLDDAEIRCMSAEKAFLSHQRHCAKADPERYMASPCTDPSLFEQALTPAPARSDRIFADSRPLWCAIDKHGTGEVFSASPAADKALGPSVKFASWAANDSPLAMMPASEAAASMTRHLNKGGLRHKPS